MRGKGNDDRESPDLCQDHPRLCGEKQTVEKAAVKRGRITPAYAGKSIVPLIYL